MTHTVILLYLTRTMYILYSIILAQSTVVRACRVDSVC